MASTTIRLSNEDQALLDELAADLGGQSKALRTALRAYASDHRRSKALDALLDEWAQEAGPVDETAVRRMMDQYEL